MILLKAEFTSFCSTVTFFDKESIGCMSQFLSGQYSGDIAKNIPSFDADTGFAVCVTVYDHEKFNSSRHSHENAHFSFVLDGGCVETQKKESELLPGNITYYHAGEIHQVIKVAAFTRRINIELQSKFFQKYNLTSEQVSNAIYVNPTAKFCLIKILKELTKYDCLTNGAIEMLVLDIVNRATLLKPSISPAWVKIISEYIHERYRDKVTLNELSTLTGMHPVTISRNFHFYFSSTLGEYIRKLRTEHALRLIKLTDRSLTDIGFECGFFDQSHFVRTFKTYTGFLPKEYQRL